MNTTTSLQTLASMTVLSSAALLITLLLRPILRRYGGPSLAYLSWLLLPLTLLATAMPQPATPMINLPMATIVAATTSTTATTLQSTGFALWTLILWGVGMAATAAWMAWQQHRFVRSLGWLQASPQDDIYFAVNNTQVGPMSLGLLYPRIVLPADFATRYSPAEQSLILAHEQVHLQRRDIWANALVSAAQVVLWFNPLVHFCANCFRLDQELACDETVIKKNPGNRKSYAAAILKTQLFASAVPLVCHWQNHHPLKERIMQISLSTPNRARRRSAMAVLAAVALATGYSAWASEHVTAKGTGANIATDAQRYEVIFDFKREVPNNTQNIKLIIAQRAGEVVELFPNEQLPVGCNIALGVNA